MTIEDTIRTEMARLEQLLGRLEDFKRSHRSLSRCKPYEHKWLMQELSVSDPETIDEAVYGQWVCTTCGVKMVKRYNFVTDSIKDPWIDLREDEEE